MMMIMTIIMMITVVAAAMMMIPQPSFAATSMGETAAAAVKRAVSSTTETTSTRTVVVLERETVKIDYDELQAVFGSDESDNIDREARRTLLLSLQKRIVDAFGSSSSSTTTTTTTILDSESSPEERTTVLSNLQQMEPLGLLEVTNVPIHIQKLRKRVLGQHAVDLAHLPPDELSKLEFPETMYTIGWSHGKEKLKKKKKKPSSASSLSSSSSSSSSSPPPSTSSSGGRENNEGRDDDKMEYDTTKGSFYFDPYADYFNDHESTSTGKRIFPEVLQPQFEHDLIEMTRFMTQVGLWVAKLCDMTLLGVQQQQLDAETTQRQVEETNNRKNSVDNESPLMIYNSLQSGRAAKARLLYYYPMTAATENDDVGGSNRYNKNTSSIGRIANSNGGGRYDNEAVPKNGNEEEEEEEEEEEFDTWCGWHKDHSSLTVLLPGLMHDYDKVGGNDGDNSNMDNVHHQAMSQRKHRPQHSKQKHKHKPGLYIQLRDRQQKYSAGKVDSSNHGPPTELVHVALQETSLGFQIGETIEIMSRGALHATPHAVKAPAPPLSSDATRRTGRASLAVFLQPLPDTPLPPLPLNDDKTCKLRSGDINGDGDVVDAMSSLKQRWRPTFGEFQKATTEAFN